MPTKLGPYRLWRTEKLAAFVAEHTPEGADPDFDGLAFLATEAGLYQPTTVQRVVVDGLKRAWQWKKDKEKKPLTLGEMLHIAIKTYDERNAYLRMEIHALRDAIQNPVRMETWCVLQRIIASANNEAARRFAPIGIHGVEEDAKAPDTSPRSAVIPFSTLPAAASASHADHLAVAATR